MWSVSVGDTYLIKKEDKVQFSVSRFAVAQAVKDFFLQAPFPAPRLITQIINRAKLQFKKANFWHNLHHRSSIAQFWKFKKVMQKSCRKSIFAHFASMPPITIFCFEAIEKWGWYFFYTGKCMHIEYWNIDN